MAEGSKQVVTKKEHKCALCYRKFPKGTKMESWTFLDVSDNSGWCTWHICNVCQKVMNEINVADYDGVIYEGACIESDREYWEKRREEIEQEV